MVGGTVVHNDAFTAGAGGAKKGIETLWQCACAVIHGDDDRYRMTHGKLFNHSSQYVWQASPHTKWSIGVRPFPEPLSRRRLDNHGRIMRQRGRVRARGQCQAQTIAVAGTYISAGIETR